MKLVLIGASGYVGSTLLQEALRRGHQVLAVVRDIEKLPVADGLTKASIDVCDENALAGAIEGRDAVISAFSPGLTDPELHAHHLAGARSIIGAAKRSGVRLLMVGGAGSLEIRPGVQLVDTAEFPLEWRETARATRDALNLLRDEPTLRWTFVAPPMHLAPGERTGQYRHGTDRVLFDDHGKSHISVADYAVALIDELEKPSHERQRFTVAY